MRILLSVALLLSVISGNPQTAKKPIGMKDFADWKSIGNQGISNDGLFISYELNPQQGDGALLLHELNNSRIDTFPRGTLSRFTYDSKTLVYRIKVPAETMKEARKKRLAADRMPLDSIAVYSLKKRTLQKFGNVLSHKLPEKDARWLMFAIRPDKPMKTKEDVKPNTLVIYNLASGDTISEDRMTDYHYPAKGGNAVFSRYEGDSTKVSSLFIFDTRAGVAKKVFEAKGQIRGITTDEEGKRYAFLFSADTVKNKVFSLYYGEGSSHPAEVVSGRLQKALPGEPAATGLAEGLSERPDAILAGQMPQGWSPSLHRSPSFSKDGSRIFLGTAPSPQPEDTTTNREPKAAVDIWSWTDDELIPEQRVKLTRDRRRTFLAVYDLRAGKLIQLADSTMDDLQLTMDGNGHIALGRDNRPYRRESSWTGRNANDYYVVDVRNGKRQLMGSNMVNVMISPTGSYLLWFDPTDSCYYARSSATIDSPVVPLIKGLPVAFFNELQDIPADVSPYGIAGWAKEDRFVYIYDRFDMWKADPTGRQKPVNITAGYGRDNNITLRYMRLDPEEKFIPDGQVMLSAFNIVDKSSGFFNANTKKAENPKMLIMDDCRFRNVRKARNADRLLWGRERCEVYPDIHTSDLSFRHSQRISDANPQSKLYNWAYTELVRWTSPGGEQLEGIVYYPEDFDPVKKYPLVLYFYERYADNLHSHSIPSPSHSTINRTFYASNGYIVFVPDITYKTGYPGQSAYDAIVSGVNYLTDNYGYIDRERIGIQGQSWGGYQVAYLITRTDMFAAAMAGAPVSNMTSAYGGMRWESGRSRMFQYEHTQSRIGATLWEEPALYIENSPLFGVPDITTPLLIMHNDNDGAVPWYQSIELFVAMRRLDKPAWMLNYRGEPHNLRGDSWENRMDLTRRMIQFFDHYLKDEPMPDWMKNGSKLIDNVN